MCYVDQLKPQLGPIIRRVAALNDLRTTLSGGRAWSVRELEGLTNKTGLNSVGEIAACSPLHLWAARKIAYQPNDGIVRRVVVQAVFGCCPAAKCNLSPKQSSRAGHTDDSVLPEAVMKG
jgi:hypothetical protein